MYVFISILILIASILLILIVLIQNSKGGGLASGFSSSNQIMGVRKTTDFLEKATWTLAGTVVVLSIVITAFIPRAQHANQSEIKEQINNAVTIDPNTVAPDFGTAQQPATAPVSSSEDEEVSCNKDASFFVLFDRIIDKWIEIIYHGRYIFLRIFVITGR